MNFRRILMTAALVAASACCAGSAQAQCGANYGCGYGGFGYWDIGRLYGVLAQNVPHYAAFPPVYYSYPVPRTYGYSPFAYPPGVMTPEVVMGEPLVINNPFVTGADASESAGAKAPVDQTTAAPAPKPLMVINPYVPAAGSELARR